MNNLSYCVFVWNYVMWYTCICVAWGDFTGFRVDSLS